MSGVRCKNEMKWNRNGLFYSLELATDESQAGRSWHLTRSEHQLDLLKMREMQQKFLDMNLTCAGIDAKWDFVHWAKHITSKSSRSFSYLFSLSLSCLLQLVSSLQPRWTFVVHLWGGGQKTSPSKAPALCAQHRSWVSVNVCACRRARRWVPPPVQVPRQWEYNILARQMREELFCAKLECARELLD